MAEVPADAVGKRRQDLAPATTAADREVPGIKWAKNDKCIDTDTIQPSAMKQTATAESLAFALESTIKYTFHLLSEIAPAVLRPYAAANVAAMSSGDFHSVVLPDLQDVLNSHFRM